MGLFLLRHLTPVVCQVEHEVAGQSVVDGLCASLPVDDDVSAGDLAENVEAFETCDEGAGGSLAEGVEETAG